MKLAILSDLHGNLEALEAVLADLDAQQVDAAACLGDFVGYGASPNECIERIRPRIEAAVLGNHDAAALGKLKLGGFNSDAATAARWTGDQLSAESRAWLDSLPLSTVWHEHRLVHASPAEPDDWAYVLSVTDARVEFAAFHEPLCFVGHSHVPGVFVDTDGQVSYTRLGVVGLRTGCRYLVNVGSVGQPRDGDPRAAYVLLDLDDERLEHRRVEYDVARAAGRIAAAGLPHFLSERLRWGE